MNMKWQDITSYSRGDKERKPTTWQIQDCNLTVTIVNTYRGCPGWFLHCPDLRIDTRPLNAADLMDAQAKALAYLANKLALLEGSLRCMMLAPRG